MSGQRIRRSGSIGQGADTSPDAGTSATPASAPATAAGRRRPASLNDVAQAAERDWPPLAPLGNRRLQGPPPSRASIEWARRAGPSIDSNTNDSPSSLRVPDPHRRKPSGEASRDVSTGGSSRLTLSGTIPSLGTAHSSFIGLEVAVRDQPASDDGPVAGPSKPGLALTRAALQQIGDSGHATEQRDSQLEAMMAAQTPLYVPPAVVEAALQHPATAALDYASLPATAPAPQSPQWPRSGEPSRPRWGTRMRPPLRREQRYHSSRNTRVSAPSAYTVQSRFSVVDEAVILGEEGRAQATTQGVRGRKPSAVPEHGVELEAGEQDIEAAQLGRTAEAVIEYVANLDRGVRSMCLAALGESLGKGVATYIHTGLTKYLANLVAKAVCTAAGWEQPAVLAVMEAVIGGAMIGATHGVMETGGKVFVSSATGGRVVPLLPDEAFLPDDRVGLARFKTRNAGVEAGEALPDTAHIMSFTAAAAVRSAVTDSAMWTAFQSLVGGCLIGGFLAIVALRGRVTTQTRFRFDPTDPLHHRVESVPDPQDSSMRLLVVPTHAVARRPQGWRDPFSAAANAFRKVAVHKPAGPEPELERSPFNQVAHNYLTRALAVFQGTIVAQLVVNMFLQHKMISAALTPLYLSQLTALLSTASMRQPHQSGVKAGLIRMNPRRPGLAGPTLAVMGTEPDWFVPAEGSRTRAAMTAVRLDPQQLAQATAATIDSIERLFAISHALIRGAFTLPSHALQDVGHEIAYHFSAEDRPRAIARAKSGWGLSKGRTMLSGEQLVQRLILPMHSRGV